MIAWIKMYAKGLFFVLFVLLLCLVFEIGRAVEASKYKALMAEDAKKSLESHVADLERVQNEFENYRKRYAALSHNFNTLRSANIGLRNEIDKLRTNANTLSCESRVVYIDTFAELFRECSARYGELAEKADRHASDAELIYKSWPKGK